MNERVRYEPFISDGSTYISNNYIPNDMSIELKKAFNNIEKWINKQSDLTPYHFLKQKLKINIHENFNDMLSFEQMDAVISAIYNLENNQKTDFILADTMGNGKGRILATIARYAFLNNRNVLFFTITDGLFSAFYEDLKTVGALNFLNEDIFIMHGTAKIYDGLNLKQSSLGSKTLNEIYKSGKTETNIKGKKVDLFSNLLFSTYSQINSQTSFENKIKFLKHFINSDTILLFDEFHKSIGDSTTRDSREQILKLGGSSIRSSATFISKYEHLESYLSLFSLSKKQDKLAILAFKDSTDLQLNAHLARYLTQNNKMIRRENQENSDLIYQEIPKEYKKQIESYLTQIRKIFYKMFECFQIVKQDNPYLKSKWTTFGSLIVRLTNSLILYGKKDYLIDIIESSIKNNQKILIVLESTFQSNIEQAMELQDMFTEMQSENKSQTQSMIKSKTKTYKGLNYSSLLYNTLINLFGFAYNQDNEEFDKLFDEIIDLIEQFPEIHLSFIDDIVDYFAEKNENVLEITGRNYYISKQKIDNEWIYNIHNKKNIDKSLIAYQFNNGWVENGVQKSSNIIILTQAGFTGISLQAHFTYKDQKQRKMIIVETTNKETELEQALGRHNRLGQTSTPETIAVSSGILFEKRKMAITQGKAQRLKSFTSNVKEISNPIFNEQINKVALQYFLDNPSFAKLIGIYLNDNTPINQTKNYYIDMLLKRSILYSNKNQEIINSIIDYTSNNYSICENDYQNNLITTFVDKIKFSNIKKVWELPNLETEIQEKIQNINKLDTFNTHLPVVYQANAINENQINKNEVLDLQKELVKNYKAFQKEKDIYQANFNNVSINSILYDQVNHLDVNKEKLLNINIGDQIIFKYKGNQFFGYLNKIEFPNQFIKTDNNFENLIGYSSSYLYEFVLINPIFLNGDNRILAQKIKITAYDLIQNELSIINKEIDWQKYQRNGETITNENLYLIGNMFYINLLSKILNIGETVTISKIMPNSNLESFLYALRLPNKMTDKQLNKMMKQHELIVSAPHAIEKLKDNVIVSLDKDIGIYFDFSIKNKSGNSIGYIIAIKNYLYKNELGHKANYIVEPILELFGKPINSILKNTLNYFNKEEYTFFKVYGGSNIMKIMYYLLFSYNESSLEPNKYYVATKEVHGD